MFTSEVLGTYENGKLIPREKVGTGFSEQDRRDYLALFKPLITKKAPFEMTDEVIWLKPTSWSSRLSSPKSPATAL